MRTMLLLLWYLTALYPRATVMRKSPEAKLVQTKRPDEVFVDVGGYYLPEQGCFDHHQRGFSKRTRSQATGPWLHSA